jgi:hypothetical protein
VADGGLMFPPEQLVSRFYFEIFSRFSVPHLLLTALLSTRKIRLQAHFKKNFTADGNSIFGNSDLHPVLNRAHSAVHSGVYIRKGRVQKFRKPRHMANNRK